MELPFGADLCWGHLQRVVVQRDELEMPQVPIAHGNVGNSVAGDVQTDERQLGQFCSRRVQIKRGRIGGSLVLNWEFDQHY